MKILHWNITTGNQPLSGVKRYEDELFNTIRKIDPSWEIQRIQRLDNKILGNTFLSWLYRYSRKNADIVHATFQTLAPVVYLRKPKKFIVTVLDLTPLVYPETQSDISTKIQWMFTPAALERADKIITISEFTKREVIRLLGIEEKKIEPIHLGVDHSIYHPMNRTESKIKFGLNTDEQHILVVASNLPHKRMDVTKEVFERVKKDYPHVKLLKVGYGDVLQGEGIINLGWVKEEDMATLYNAADVFLHTAEYEGFGLPVLEAMACGVPVVVSKSASLPEIVGDSGYLVDLSHPGYADIFSKAIMENLKEGSVKDVVERSKLFTWERTALETYNVYKEVKERA